MADVDLPTNAVEKRAVQGAVVASRKLGTTETGGAVTTAGQSAQICDLPEGALVTDIVFQSSINLGNCQLGIEGASVTDDPDHFRASAASGANATVRGDLRLPYRVQTAGEAVTITAANAITSASSGVASVTYSMDGFVV